MSRLQSLDAFKTNALENISIFIGGESKDGPTAAGSKTIVDRPTKYCSDCRSGDEITYCYDHESSVDCATYCEGE